MNHINYDRALRLLAAAGMTVLVAVGCGSKEITVEDDREISEQQLQQGNQMQKQLLEQGLRAQQENMQKLREMQQTAETQKQ